MRLSSSFANIGIGLDAGWKEESIWRQTVATGEKHNYDFQFTRVLAGPYLTLHPFRKAGVVHFYFGYDPIVWSHIHYVDDDHISPFDERDNLTGKAYTGGLGFGVEGVLIRFLGRRVIYDKIEARGVDHKLPSDTYSNVETDELVLHIGSSF